MGGDYRGIRWNGTVEIVILQAQFSEIGMTFFEKMSFLFLKIDKKT